MGAGGGIVRDLVSPMWRTTWDAHGMRHRGYHTGPGHGLPDRP